MRYEAYITKEQFDSIVDLFIDQVCPRSSRSALLLSSEVRQVGIELFNNNEHHMLLEQVLNTVDVKENGEGHLSNFDYYSLWVYEQKTEENPLPDPIASIHIWMNLIRKRAL